MRLDAPTRREVSPAEAAPADESPTRRTTARRRTGIGIALVVVAILGIVAVVRFQDDVRRAAAVVAADAPRAASDKTVLADMWRVYKDIYVEAGSGRTVDHQSEGITTSEGQSYTMMRAVWQDDQATFATSWQWTKDNLQRDDGLMAWNFGQRADGSFGIREEIGGGNSATDADVDIAFALLMAYSRWKDDTYLYDALPIIDSVWEKEVVRVGDRLVLAANDLERFDLERVIVNPSYLAPYAYRVFAAVDEEHDWAGLVDSSYAFLEDLQDQPLGAGTAAGLPPDWVAVDRVSGEFAPVSDRQTTRFGYEALRLPWRLALDHIWYGEERARRLLEGQSLLAREWTEDNRLAAEYERDGRPAVDYESPATYGGTIGFFEVVHPRLADEVHAERLLSVYDADNRDVDEDLGYYESNWVWFGMALHLDELPNLNVTQE